MDLSHLCILYLSPHHTVVFLAAIHRICEMLCCGKQGVALGLAPANLREGVKKKLVKSGQADRLGRPPPPPPKRCKNLGELIFHCIHCPKCTYITLAT